MLDVDEHARYVIARYFRPVDKKLRTRASRTQVKRFVAAALRTCVREQEQEILDARGKSVAQRLQAPVDTGALQDSLFLKEPKEKQRNLAW